MKIRTPFRSSLTMFLLSALTMLIGFVVQLVLASKLGTGWEMDAYLVGIVLPTFLTTITINAISSTLVPIFKESQASTQDTGFQSIFRNFFARIWIIALGFIILCIFLAAPIVRLIAPGFSQTSAELTTGILRIMLMGTFFDILRGALTAYYFTEEKFFLPYFVPILNHVCMLIGGLWLIGFLGVYGLAWAWTVGSVVMFIVLYLPLGRIHLFAFRWRPDPRLSKTMAFLLPVLLATVLGQATPILDRMVGSTLPVGSISYLGYGSKLLDILLRTVPMAIILSIFPPMSLQAAKKNVLALEDLVSSGIRMIILTTVPIGVYLFVFREPLIMILFQRGNFTSEATRMVSAALAWYMIAFLPVSVLALLTYVFFSIQRAWTLVKTGLLGCLITLLLNFLFSRLLGFQGIAISSIIVSSILCGMLILLYRGSEAKPRITVGVSWLMKIGGAAGIMLLILFLLQKLLPTIPNVSFQEAVLLFSGLLLGGFVYFVVLLILGTPEIGRMIKIIKEYLRSLARNPVSAPGDGPGTIAPGK